MSVIKTIDDLTLVPTPVKYSMWRSGGRVEEVREELRADLFKGDRKATIIMSGAYGQPFIETGRLTRLYAEPGRSGRPGVQWRIWLSIIRPRKRNAACFDRDFPMDAALLAWGEHKIDLTGLPPNNAGIWWHSPNFPAMWREVSKRFRTAAGSDVWMDTTEAAAVDWHRRHAEKAA